MNAVREDANEDSELESQLTDLNGALSELAAQRDALRYVLHTEDEEIVRWLEASSTYKVKSLRLDRIADRCQPAFATVFFDAKESVVMTSATLTVDRSFEYVIRQLGLVSYESADRLKALSFRPRSTIESRLWSVSRGTFRNLGAPRVRRNLSTTFAIVR